MNNSLHFFPGLILDESLEWSSHVYVVSENSTLDKSGPFQFLLLCHDNLYHLNECNLWRMRKRKKLLAVSNWVMPTLNGGEAEINLRKCYLNLCIFLNVYTLYKKEGKKDNVVSMITSNHILICLHLQNFLHYYYRLRSKKLRFTWHFLTSRARTTKTMQS